MKTQTFGLTYALIVLILSHLLLFTLADAQALRWMRVDPLQSCFVDFGNECELLPYNHAFLSWPAQYGDNQYTTWAKGLWMGAQNFYDPVEQRIKPTMVIGSGPRNDTVYGTIDQVNMIFPRSIRLVGRSIPPEVLVDGQPGSTNRLYDILDEVDPSLRCDRMIVIRFNTSIGVSVTKRILAFTQQNHNNYFIHDYVFTNTGIYNAAGDTLQQTLNQFWVHFQYHNTLAGVTATGYGSTWGDFSSMWGSSTDCYDFGNPYRTRPDSLRGFYAFYSPNQNRLGMGITYAQDWGCPNQLGGGPNLDGLLGSAKYVGAATLCASASPQNWSDDYSQPRTTTYFGGEDPVTYWPATMQDNDSFMQLRYAKMTEGHWPQSMAESVGDQYVNDSPWWSAHMQGNADAGPTQGQGFGPYTLAPGDSIHIVFAEGVSGLSWEACRSVGANWYAYYSGTGTPTLVKPDGSTTTSYTDYTKAWVQSGRDSIIQTYKNARTNYKSGYSIPNPPPAPNQFKVESGGDRIHLIWADNADSWPHFDGYVVYRSTGRVKDYLTVYEKIFECNKVNVVHSYYDTTAKADSAYYYYIQSKDDGTQNDVEPGKPLFSSLFLTLTSSPARLNVFKANDFRSHQSGDWNDPNTWEQLNGSVWMNPAPFTPSAGSGNITIGQGHTITVISSDTADQIIIEPEAELLIQSTGAFHVRDGDSADLKVHGTLTNLGTITQDPSASIEFSDNSKYLHGLDGGSIPKATWASGSTCQIDSVKTSVPLNMDQKFAHLAWKSPGQTADLNLSWDNISVGDFTVISTGGRTLQLCSPPADSSATMSIGELRVQPGAVLTVGETDNPGTAITLYSDNITITGGGFSICKGSQGGTGTTVCHVRGNFTASNAAIQNSNIAGIKLVFDGSSQHLTLGPAVTMNALPVEVDSGSILHMDGTTLSGSGSFTLNPGATLELTQPGGIDSTIRVTGAKIFRNCSNFIYSGTTTQQTGSLLPDTVGNLTIANMNGVVLTQSHNITVAGQAELQKGTLSSSGNSLSYGTNGTLKYSDSTAQTTSNVEFPSSQGPHNLLIQNPSGVILHGTRALKGYADIRGKLFPGINSLMAASATSLDTNSYVVTDSIGSFKLSSVATSTQLCPVGTRDAYAPIWISNTGVPDTIGVRVADDAGKPVGGGRIKAKWEIGESTPGGGNYTIKFGWMTKLEDPLFQNGSLAWRIFRLSDTTQIAASGFPRGTMTGGRTVQHAAISTLDWFTVGTFTSLTDVEESQTGIPVEFRLKQNYPNPFNPSTTIRYDLPKASHVTLTVYDLLGREVATLVNRVEEAGYKSAIFNATNLASGVYFCRLKAGSFTQTRKLILLR